MLSWIKLLSKVKFWNLGSPSPLLSLVLVSRLGAHRPTLALFFSAWILSVGSVTCSAPTPSMTCALYVEPLLPIETEASYKPSPDTIQLFPGFFPRRNFQKFLPEALVWYALSVYRSPEAIDCFLILISTNDCLVLEDFWKPLRMPPCWTHAAQLAVKDQPLLWLKMRWPCSTHSGHCGQTPWLPLQGAVTVARWAPSIIVHFTSPPGWGQDLSIRVSLTSSCDTLNTFLQLNSVTLTQHKIQ